MSPIIILYIEFDLSLSTGYSINERESARALLDIGGEGFRLVTPVPEFPEEFDDARACYVENPRRYRPFPYIKHLISTWRVLQRPENRSAIIVTRLGPLPLLPLFLVLAGRKVVLKKYAVYSLALSPLRSWRTKLLSKFILPLYRFIGRRAVFADVESYAYEKWFQTSFSMPKAKLFYIPNGVNSESFCPSDQDYDLAKWGVEPGDTVVCYVGAFEPFRNLDYLFKLDPVAIRSARMKFLCIGDGPEHARFVARTREEGVHDFILAPGRIPYGDVPWVLGAVHIGLDLSCIDLAPDCSGSAEYLGSFSQKIPQYLSCGLPVVAIECRDTKILSEKNVGALCVPDGEGLADAIFKARAIGNQSEARTRCREVGKSFSSEQIAKDRLALWREVS